MYSELEGDFMTAPAIEPYVPDPNLQPAVICDIDGTLAHPTRDFHDYSLVETDAVDPVIRNLMDREWAVGYDILIVTGRPHAARKATYSWLVDNHVPVDALWTSPAGVDDYIAKADIFEKHIRNSYCVEYVLEDRNRCVEMWRGLGLKCLQVAPGAF